MTIATATISGQFVLPDLTGGGSMRATIEAHADAAMVTYPGMVIGKKINIPIGGDGTATVTVPKIPQAGLLPTSADVQWHVNVKSGNESRDYYFTLTADTTWDQVLTPSSVAAPALAAAANAALNAALTAQAAASASATAAAGSAASASAIADPTGGYAHQIGNGNGTDDTTNLNGLLSTAGHFRATPGQNYIISAPLVLKSGTTLDMTGATLTLKAGSTCNMVTNFSAKNPVATATDAAVTSGSNVVTTSLGATAVVGQTLWVAGAAANGNGPLIGNITARTATTVTIAKLSGGNANATATVSGAAVRLYNRDSNITVKGGTWDRGTNGPDSGGGPMLGIIGHSFFMAHVDGLRIDLDKIASTHGITFLWITDASNFEATIRSGNVVRTAMQVVGPIYDGRIPYLRASSTDDLLNVCGNVYPDQTDTCGDVRNVSVGTIYADTVGASAFKVNCGQGLTIDGITTQQIGGVANIGAYIGEDTAQAATTGGNYGTVNFGHIDITTTAGKSMLVGGATVRHLIASVAVKTSQRGVSISGVNPNPVDLFDLTLDVTGAVADAVQITGAALVNQLVIRGRIDSSATGSTVTLGAASETPNVKRITFDKVRANYSSSPGQMLGIAANGVTLGTAVFDDCYPTFASNATGTNAMFYLAFNTTVGHVKFQGGRVETAGACLRADSTITSLAGVHFGQNLHMVTCDRVAVLAKATKVWLGQVIVESPVSPAFAFTGGAGIIYNIYGGTLISPSSGTVSALSRGSTELVRINAPELSVDLSKVSKVTSTEAINDNGALSCGAGPVICDGTSWKHKYTAATYIAPQ